MTYILYIPTPTDTFNVVLLDGLLELAERLDENVQEVWAKTCID